MYQAGPSLAALHARLGGSPTLTRKGQERYALARPSPGVSESDADVPGKLEPTALQLLNDDDPDESRGVVDDGINERPSEARPVYLQVCIASRPRPEGVARADVFFGRSTASSRGRPRATRCRPRTRSRGTRC